MSKALIETAIGHAANLTNAQARSAAAAVMRVMADELRTTGKFGWLGFGTLTVREQPERNGRNPRTGAPMVLAASKTVRFVPSKTLRQELQMAEPASAHKAASSSGAPVPAAEKPPARPAKAAASPPAPAKDPPAATRQAKAAPASKLPAKAAPASKRPPRYR
jgi:DNA-binding protein HU-beta